MNGLSHESKEIVYKWQVAVKQKCKPIEEGEQGKVHETKMKDAAQVKDALFYCCSGSARIALEFEFQLPIDRTFVAMLYEDLLPFIERLTCNPKAAADHSDILYRLCIFRRWLIPAHIPLGHANPYIP